MPRKFPADLPTVYLTETYEDLNIELVEAEWATREDFARIHLVCREALVEAIRERQIRGFKLKHGLDWIEKSFRICEKKGLLFQGDKSKQWHFRKTASC